MKAILILIMLATISISCNVQPEPIAYGHDACHFCKMTIVDQTHAAQLMTKKGKQFKYDAIECMVNDVQENYTPENLSVLLVANYSNAGEMIDANKAHYIISPGITSPMGANLSAVDTQEKIENLKQEHSGVVHSWESLQTHFKENTTNNPH